MEVGEEEQDNFIKENPIIFKKYKVKKKLGEGAFGDVFLGQAINNNDYVAIKTEPRKIIKPILESEAFLLYSIKSYIFWYTYVPNSVWYNSISFLSSNLCLQKGHILFISLIDFLFN